MDLIGRLLLPIIKRYFRHTMYYQISHKTAESNCMQQIGKNWRALGSALVAVVIFALINVKAAETNIVKSAEADPIAQKYFIKLIKALETKNLSLFVEDGDANFKAAATKDVIGEGYAAYGTRLKKGYEATYLTQLKQQGCQVHLWKLAFKDGKDDMLAKLTIFEGKVAGFSCQ